MGTDIGTDLRWYVVRTYSGHENKVKAYLEHEIQEEGLSYKVTNILIPMEKVFEIRDGKKRTKSKSLFPGYVLVECIMDKEIKHLIQNTPSVISFLGSKDEPVPLRPDEVKRLLGTLEERANTEMPMVQYRVGDPVRVISGPFNNFNGFVQEVNQEKMKLKVMVSIFGRKTPIELDFNQVEPES